MLIKTLKNSYIEGNIDKEEMDDDDDDDPDANNKPKRRSKRLS